jgi:hypothetical protein
MDIFGHGPLGLISSSESIIVEENFGFKYDFPGDFRPSN